MKYLFKVGWIHLWNIYEIYSMYIFILESYNKGPLFIFYEHCDSYDMKITRLVYSHLKANIPVSGKKLAIFLKDVTMVLKKLAWVR